jgi:hypothetical protein
MVNGSGLLARAFALEFAHNSFVCVHASGVSNSSCTDMSEFAREREQLSKALIGWQNADVFLYFGTCSVADPTAVGTPYVQHKLAMEQLVQMHPKHLILRLPQIAGITNNPHTLLNTLRRHLVTGLEFPIWRNAFRNIIDIEDAMDRQSRVCLFKIT